MIKKYKVTIDDVVYKVSVESMKDGSEKAVPGTLPVAPSVRTAAPVSRPAPKQETPVAPAPKKEEPKPAAPVGGAGKTITAPLPGNMWKVKTSNGQTVKRGDVLFIIEAMKMENEIFAPCDGTVSSVSVAEGSSVNTGDVLCVIG